MMFVFVSKIFYFSNNVNVTDCPGQDDGERGTDGWLIGLVVGVGVLFLLLCLCCCCCGYLKAGGGVEEDQETLEMDNLAVETQ